MSDEQLQHLLQHLDDAHLTNRDEAGNHIVLADLGELSLAELYRSGPYILPLIDHEELPREQESDRKLHKLLSEMGTHAEAGLNKPIKYYLSENADD